jgi:hypothetical protein
MRTSPEKVLDMGTISHPPQSTTSRKSSKLVQNAAYSMACAADALFEASLNCSHAEAEKLVHLGNYADSASDAMAQIAHRLRKAAA